MTDEYPDTWICPHCWAEFEKDDSGVSGVETDGNLICPKCDVEFDPSLPPNDDRYPNLGELWELLPTDD